MYNATIGNPDTIGTWTVPYFEALDMSELSKAQQRRYNNLDVHRVMLARPRGRGYETQVIDASLRTIFIAQNPDQNWLVVTGWNEEPF